MMGRRSAALLCVLLAHALILLFLLRLGPPPERALAELETAPITITLEPLPLDPLPLPTPAAAPRVALARAPVARQEAAPAAAPAATPDGESAAITLPGHVDWPIEGKKSAAKILAAEAEAARIAKMFSGPNGTWAS